MKDINVVSLAGKVTRVGNSYIKQQFAFINADIDNIPITISLGGKNYNEQMARNMEATLKGANATDSACYGVIMEGHIEEMKGKYAGKWEVKAKDSVFVPSLFPVNPMSHVVASGKIKELAPDEHGIPWITLGSSYYSKNPKTGEGSFKDRTIRVKLDKLWQPTVLGRRILIYGSIASHIDKSTKLVHVVANESIVL